MASSHHYDALFVPMTQDTAHTTHAEPTTHLRWNGAILEQRWQITTFPVGSQEWIAPSYEWRPVPQVDGAITELPGNPIDHIVSDDAEQVTVFVAAENGEPMFERADGTPIFESDLCEDEGCPHHGTEHVCINRVEESK